jgi:LuxR family maltose regulon positive regulatory protein
VALKKVRPSNIFLRSRILLQLGESNSVLGELQTGIHYLHEAIASSTKEADYSVATVAYFRLGNILKIMGRLAEAEEMYDQNIKALQQMGGYDSPMLGKPEIGRGDLLRERGELEAARKLFLSGHKHMERQGQPYDLVYSYMHQARLAEADGNLEPAQELVAQTESIFRAFTVPPIVRMILDCYQVTLWLRLGRLPQVEKWVKEKRLSPEMELSYATELPLITLGRVFIAQGKLTEALELLSRLESEARKGERNGRVLEILILKALAFQQAGKAETAQAVLGQAIDIAQPEGFFRTFLDEGEPMRRLLEQARASATVPARYDYLDRLQRGKSGMPQANS